MCQPSSPVSGSFAGRQIEIGRYRLDRLEVEGLAGTRIERAQLGQHVAQILVVDAAAAAQLAEFAGSHEIEIVEQRLHRRIEAIALGELGAQALGDGAREETGRLHLAQPRPDRFDDARCRSRRPRRRRRRRGGSSRPRRDLRRASARCGALPDPRTSSSICSSTWTASDARTLGHEVEGIGGILALADAACSRGIAAAIGDVRGSSDRRRSAQGRARRRQGFGRVADRRRGPAGASGSVTGPSSRSVSSAAADSFRSSCWMKAASSRWRKLQQLDGLLKLRRHRQGLA